MERKIPIDQLFRQNLVEGKEQINLSAWANMERLLDGQNPYAKKEDKRRGGLWPLFLLSLMGSSLIGGGLYYSSQISNETVTIENPKSTQATKLSTQVTANSIDHRANNGDIVVDVKEPLKSGLNKESAVITENKPSKAGQHLENKSNADFKNKSQNATVTSKQLKSSPLVHEQPVPKTNYLDKKLNSRHPSSSSNTKENELIATSNPLPGITTSVQSQASDAISQEAITYTKVPVVNLHQKQLRKRDGSILKTTFDTLGASVIEQANPVSAELVASIDPYISNPRYHPLSESEEIMASQRNASVNTEDQVTIATVAEPEASASSSQQSLTSQNQQQKQYREKNNYFDNLRQFYRNTYQKVSDFVLYGKRPDSYGGISMGFNMSLSNSKHNFGGFQAGYTQLIPLNDYLSFLGEMRFFYRNNGGYTVNDISYKILNTSIDNQALVHHNIYNYQMDSMVKTYNFKHFYSLELPLLIQANYRSVALYGGINMAYNFKLGTTEKNRNFVSNHADTVLKNQTYSFPAEKASIVQRSDFGSRFGLGYTIGGAYSFSPQVYLDIRLTQTLWDNMKTLAARDISNGTSKLPTVQLSLGYRFRKFTPDN